jgi:uncharacterized protein (DUF305 family)
MTSDHAGAHRHDPRLPGSTASFAEAMNEAMARMMRDMHAGPMTGDPDQDFLRMMIPHHEGAIEMARLLLLHGSDPLVRALSADIIAVQMVEIEAMRNRLRSLVGAAAVPEYPALTGVRGG